MNWSLTILLANVVATLFLIGLIWMVQVPCHERLVKGFDMAAYKWLVNFNWIRTIAWTARGAIVAWMLIRVLSK